MSSRASSCYIKSYALEMEARICLELLSRHARDPSIVKGAHVLITSSYPPTDPSRDGSPVPIHFARPIPLAWVFDKKQALWMTDLFFLCGKKLFFTRLLKQPIQYTGCFCNIIPDIMPGSLKLSILWIATRFFDCRDYIP